MYPFVKPLANERILRWSKTSNTRGFAIMSKAAMAAKLLTRVFRRPCHRCHQFASTVCNKFSSGQIRRWADLTA